MSEFYEETKDLSWTDYCEKYNTDTLCFEDKKRNILVTIAEGCGDNLTYEDRIDGYVAYWYAEVYSLADGNCGGGLMLLESYIGDSGETVGELIAFLEENADAFDGIKGIPLAETLIDPDEGDDRFYSVYEPAELQRYKYAV